MPGTDTASPPSVRDALVDAMSKSLSQDEPGAPFRLSHWDAAARFKETWIYASPQSVGFPPHDASGSHLFLFFKNLGVTDLAVAELAALLRLNTRHRENLSEVTDESIIDQDCYEDIQFFDDKQYTTYLRQLIFSLYGSPSPNFADRQAAIEHVERVAAAIDVDHGDVLRNTIIFRTFFTTALVHIPLSLRTNIRRVVAESGYIQSAGYSIYVRRAESADMPEFRQKLETYFGAQGSKKLYFTPYAVEYFNPYENQFSSPYEIVDVSVSTRNGLDGVRLDLRKHFFSGQPLRDVLRNIAEDYEARLYVAKGLKAYGVELSDAQADHDLSREASIWMITDHQPLRTEENSYVRSKRSYLITYAQYQSNDNQLIIFKERKPGWVASVTLPHTLSTALINIGREATGRRTANRLEEPTTPLVVDPFCGTGTTLFDAALRLPEAMVVGFDMSRSMPQVVKDNASFFSLDGQSLEPIFAGLLALYTRIDDVIKQAKGSDIEPLARILNNAARPGARALSQVDKKYNQYLLTAVDACIKEMATGPSTPAGKGATGIDRVHNEGFTEELLARFGQQGSLLEERLLFYIAWRGLVSNRHALGTDPEQLGGDLTRAVHLELKNTLSEFNTLLKKLNADVAGRAVGAPNFIRRPDGYSDASIVNPARVKKIAAGLREARIEELAGLHDDGSKGVFLVRGDAMEGLTSLKRRVDLLIGDPPYWFNTSEIDLFEEQRFYGRFIKAAVGSIRSGGQLMIILPSFARNGRQFPYFQTRDAVVRQLMTEIEGQGRRAISVVRTSSEEKDLFKPPFFWQSPSALSRSVIWFTIED